MKQRFRYLHIVLMLLVMGLAAACAPAVPEQGAAPEEPAAAAEESAAEDEVVELRWLQWWVNEWGPENHAALIEGFEAEHPNIRVTVVDVPWPEMAGKLQAAAAGDETYDIFGIEGSWISGLDRQGYIENLDSWLEEDPEFADKLTDTTARRLAGDIKSLCLYLIPYQFAYNVDVFEEKGLEPPTNWDEFIAVMEALHDPASGSYGMSMPLQDASFIMTRYFGFRLAQEGGDWFDEEGNVAFNSPEGVRALQWWKDFYDMGLVVPGSLGEDQSQMLEFIAAEQVPSAIDGPFIWTKAKQLNPDIRMAYAPAWTAETGGYSWSCSGVGMAADSEHKEEAWEFIKYLYSDEVSIEMTEAVSLLWATKAAVNSLEEIDDPLLSQVPAFANQDPEHNVTFPVLPNSTELVDALGLAFQQVMAGEADAQTALDEAAAVWEEALSQ